MRKLLTQDEIRDGVERLAGRLRADYGQRPLTIVGILTGSLVMLADLIRQLDNPLRVALIRANQYRGEAHRRTALVIDDKLLPNLAGRDVLVVDDIFDTGHTLVEVIAQLAKHRPDVDPLGRALAQDRPLRGRRSSPITLCSTSRTNSSSATDSTTKIGTATCRTSRRWNRRIFNRLRLSAIPFTSRFGVAADANRNHSLSRFSRMPRILHIIPTFDRAGAEKQLLVLARGLAREGFDVHVCALTRGGPLRDEFRAAGIPDHRHRQTAQGRPDRAGAAAAAHPPPAAGSGPHLDFRGRHVTAASPPGRPASSASSPANTASTAGRAPGSGLSTVDSRDSPTASSSTARPSATTAPSTACRARNSTVIANGVEPARASDVSRCELLRELALSARRPADRRGRPALAAETREGPHLGGRPVAGTARQPAAVGDRRRAGTRRRSQQFARLASDLDHIRFLGHRDDVWRIMPHLDVLWNGSGYEGQPNAVMEAMAAGVPVVASDIPGNRELVVHGETGYLVPIAGRAARARATDQIFNDAALAARLGAAAKQRMLEHFSVEQNVARHAELYRELMG